MKKPTKQQVEELNHLALLPDEAIDTGDIPEITNWEHAVIGRFYSKRTKPSIAIGKITKIEDIEGIGSKYAEMLRMAGITSVEKLLEFGATAKGREELSARVGVSSTAILRWVNHADLYRIKGVARQFSELLEAAGVDTVPELAQRNAENLQRALAKVNEVKKVSKTTPSLIQISKWIATAKILPRVVEH
ncbi:MAG: DUF4332 domain-containing protein [Methyloglobulus sp.]